ncbi:MAG: TlpA family protein disulfide reductase [Leptospiraceae bacterium]|nr:TlpA family protein disulfide reductase [Leptospiraceae bacterium]MDW8306373.1 TlpA disulfide reductase family protein [Leptospiraceae bacterium]
MNKLLSALRKNKVASFILEIAILLMIFETIHLYQKRHLLKEKAPALVLKDLSGQSYSLESHKRYLVYFFAPWCRVCKLNFDNLARLKSIKNPKTFEIYAIALSYENEQEIRDFIQNYPVSYPILLGNDETGIEWKIKGFPTFYVVENGHIVSSSVGYTSTLGMWWRSL